MLKEKEITIMSLHLGYGGIEQYISSLCKMLEDDFKINIITTYKVLDKPAFPFSDKIKITYLMNSGPNRKEFKDALKHKNPFLILKEGIKSIKILYLKRKLNIKAIKSIDSKYVITTRDFHNHLVGKYANPSCIKIATEHNYHNNDMKYVNNLVKSVKNFDYFVLVSSTLTDYYQKLVNGPKCVFIPNIIDAIPKEKSKLTSNVLAAIGRMEKEKAFDDLITIISLIKPKIPDIKLYLMGDGSLKPKLMEQAKTLNLMDNIIFTGYVNKIDMSKYLLKSKLYVMTSHTESFGIVLLEAMSHGIPCIAFDSADGARELLKNDVGILIKERDKQKMADAIIKLLVSDTKVKEMANKGNEFVKNYLPENVKTEWLSLLK